jgi:uncharacterized protein RhaS with RHS repeats
MLTSQYFYDVFGRRIAHPISRPRDAGATESDDSSTRGFYGWDGDRLTLTQLPAQDRRPPQRIHTIYEPNSLVSLLRVETEGLLPQASLADLWEQNSGHAADAQQRDMLAEVRYAACAKPQHPRLTAEAFTRMQQL